MSRLTTYFHKMPVVAAAMLAVALCIVPRPAHAQSSNQNFIYEDEGFLDRLQDVNVNATTASPFEDVPPDHWAYRAVKRLADAGLLNGYNGQLFRGDQVITRYEMAVLVAKLLDNYLEWYKSGGHVTRDEYNTANWPDIAGAGPAPAPTTGAPLRAISPPDAVIAPSRRVSVDLPSLGSMSIEKSTPKTMDQMPQNTTYTSGPVGVTPEVDKLIGDKVGAAVTDKVNLDMKKIADLEKLVNEFKGELKTLKKDLSKDIKETNRISLQNKKSIEDLQQENDRFSMKGTERFFWYTGGPITGNGCIQHDLVGHTNSTDPNLYRCNLRTANLANSITLSFSSKPDKTLPLSIGGAFSAYTQLGGKRIYRTDRKSDPGFDSTDTKVYDYFLQQSGAAYRGYLEGANTALMVSNLFINYENPDDPKHPRNFKMRSMYFGDISVPLSLMPIMGMPVQGLTTSLKLNNYTVTLFGDRERLHQRNPFFVNDYTNYPGGGLKPTYYNEDQFDRYKYGASIQTNIFGNPSSSAYFTRMTVFDNKDTNYPGCNTGQWIDLAFTYDLYSQSSPDSDLSTTDLFCGPPIKNSVTSLFAIYPLFSGLNLMANYSHSEYFKPGYKLLAPFNIFGSGTGAVDTSKMSDKYNKWWPSREINDQDEAFFALFSYGKGPLSIFPVGYLHLGPNFMSPDLEYIIGSLAGSGGDFDIKSMLSILPITIQSLDLKVGSLKYEFKDKSVADTMYLDINEIKPIYFDPGGLASGFASNGSKGTVLTILNTAIDRINNRNTLLNIKVWNSNYKIFLANNITFTAGYLKVGALLPTSCLDADVVPITDDFGNVIDKTIGNGTADCTPDPNTQDINFGLKYWLTTQKYELGWDTSKNTHLITGFKIKDSSLKLSMTKQVEDIIQGLTPKGKNYQLYSELKYKLSSSTRLKFYYEMNYARYPQGQNYYNSNLPHYTVPVDINGYKFPLIDNQKFYFMVESNF